MSGKLFECPFGSESVSHLIQHVRGSRTFLDQSYVSKGLPWYLRDDFDEVPPFNFTLPRQLQSYFSLESRVKERLNLSLFTNGAVNHVKGEFSKLFYLPPSFLTMESPLRCSCGVEFEYNGLFLFFAVNYYFHLLSSHSEKKLQKIVRKELEVIQNQDGNKSRIPQLIVDYLPSSMFLSLMIADGLRKTNAFLCRLCYQQFFTVRKFTKHCTEKHNYQVVNGFICVDESQIGSFEESSRHYTLHKLMIVHNEDEEKYKWKCDCSFKIEHESDIQTVVSVLNHLFLSTCTKAVEWRSDRKQVFKDLEQLKADITKDTVNGEIAEGTLLSSLYCIYNAVTKRYFASDKRSNLSHLCSVNWSELKVCPFCCTVINKVAPHFQSCQNIKVIEAEKPKKGSRKRGVHRISVIPEEIEEKKEIKKFRPKREISKVKINDNITEVPSTSTTIVKPTVTYELPLILQRGRNKCSLCNLYIHTNKCTPSVPFMAFVHLMDFHKDQLPPSGFTKPSDTFPPIDWSRSLDINKFICHKCGWEEDTFTEIEAHAMMLHPKLQPKSYKFSYKKNK